MKTQILGVLAFAVSLGFGGAQAESFQEMCVRVSTDWGSAGDLDSQCECLAAEVAGDDALTEEFWAFEDNFSNDTDAYEGSSDGAKAALDSCTA